MVELELPPISSKLVVSTGTGGQRDYTVSLAGGLVDDEVISTLAITSADTTILTVSSPAISADGRGANFHVTILPDIVARLGLIYIAFEGDSSSSDTYKVRQPIQETLNG